jgi:Protein of unknown function (DUF3710)
VSLFRRRREATDPAAGEPADDAPQDQTDDPDGAYPDGADPDGADPDGGQAAELDDGSGEEAERADALSDRSNGPWDASERPEREGYVDLGAVRLRGRDGMELRLEVEEASGRVTAATVALGGSAVQLQAFAAPRTEGIWEEIRAEIAASITRQGGTADEVPGKFGRELIARIPVRTPDGRTGHQPARFAGVNGPRWFLRAVFHGAAVYEAEAAALLESVVRDVVVDRGGEAMAPRELLALRLPDSEAGSGAVGGAEAAATVEREPLEPFRRGPEITEVR